MVYDALLNRLGHPLPDQPLYQPHCSFVVIVLNDVGKHQTAQPEITEESSARSL